jgi:hypothetical protein
MTTPATTPRDPATSCTTSLICLAGEDQSIWGWDDGVGSFYAQL